MTDDDDEQEIRQMRMAVQNSELQRRSVLRLIQVRGHALQGT